MQGSNHSCLRRVLMLALAMFGGQSATAATLFDPALGLSPEAQGFNRLGLGIFQQTPAGLIDLDTTLANALQAGYISELPADGSAQHPAIPVLDRVAGFKLEFSLKVLTEAHLARDDNTDGRLDRAGFSVIAIGEDLFGLELGFFTDRVWAYEDANPNAGGLFTQAEFALLDTSANLLDYVLSVHGMQYQLTQNGSALLTGTLRNYNPSGVDAAWNPYDNSSLLFFGDDTGSARSHVQIGRIAIAPVPLPPAALLLAGPLFLMGLRRSVFDRG